MLKSMDAELWERRHVVSCRMFTSAKMRACYISRQQKQAGRKEAMISSLIWRTNDVFFVMLSSNSSECGPIKDT